MAVAFFDIDHTIISSISAEKIFFFYLMKKRKIPPINYFRVVFFFCKDILWHPYKATLQNKQYLANQKKDDVIKWGKECFHNEIKKKISQDAISAISAHKKKNDKVILLSGNLFFLAELIKEYVGSDDVICTNLETNKGLFTGKITGLHPYGATKKILLQEYLKKNNLSNQEIYCYANSVSDMPFLSCADKPVAVNASRRLKKNALDRHWSIVSFA